MTLSDTSAPSIDAVRKAHSITSSVPHVTQGFGVTPGRPALARRSFNRRRRVWREVADIEHRLRACFDPSGWI